MSICPPMLLLSRLKRSVSGCDAGVPEHDENGQLRTSAAPACIDVGIEDFRFQGLRHTAASWMSGANIHTVALALGHKDLRMATRYQHLSPAFLGEAVAKLDGVFGDLRCQPVANQNLLIENPLVTATN